MTKATEKKNIVATIFTVLLTVAFVLIVVNTNDIDILKKKDIVLENSVAQNSNQIQKANLGLENTQKQLQYQKDLTKGVIKSQGSIAGNVARAFAQTSKAFKTLVGISEENKEIARKIDSVEEKNYITQEQLESSERRFRGDIREVEKSIATLLTDTNTKFNNVDVKFSEVTADVVELKKAEAPIGAIYFSSSSVAPANGKWELCTGANGTPNLMSSGAFLKGGIYTGIIEPDTTAVNGLTANIVDLQNNNFNVGITYYAAVSNGSTSANQGATQITRQVNISGDTVTKPISVDTYIFCKTS